VSGPDRIEWARERLAAARWRGRDELNLTEGGIGWPLFFLSLPIVVTNLLQTAYNLADTFWLGQYSTTALAAISFGFPLVFLLIALGMGVSVAGSVLSKDAVNEATHPVSTRLDATCCERKTNEKGPVDEDRIAPTIYMQKRHRTFVLVQ